MFNEKFHFIKKNEKTYTVNNQHTEIFRLISWNSEGFQICNQTGNSNGLHIRKPSEKLMNYRKRDLVTKAHSKKSNHILSLIKLLCCRKRDLATKEKWKKKADMHFFSREEAYSKIYIFFDPNSCTVLAFMEGRVGSFCLLDLKEKRSNNLSNQSRKHSYIRKAVRTTHLRCRLWMHMISIL